MKIKTPDSELKLVLGRLENIVGKGAITGNQASSKDRQKSGLSGERLSKYFSNTVPTSNDPQEEAEKSL